MLKKLSPQYESKATIDDILAEISTLKRLKFPMLLVCVGAFCIGMCSDLLVGLGIVPRDIIFPWWALYYGIAWGISILGFFYYRRKLLQIMPLAVLPKIQKVKATLPIYLFTLISDTLSFLLLLLLLFRQQQKSQLFQ
jgi:hypothetical protein